MKLVVGTRGSLLALTQTKIVTDALVAAHPGLTVEFKEIRTRGDKKQGTPEASKGDKKDWIYELELEVLAETIDIAVHSGKDIPSDFESGTEIISVLKREDPRDVFIGKKDDSGKRIRFSDVPRNGQIGTASLRRQAALKQIRKDLSPVEHRGNVPTRIKKLDESTTLSGIVLARAGVERLKVEDCQFEEFSPSDMMPAVNQGILCVQFKESRSEIRKVLSAISDPGTQNCFIAERSCVALLGADCKSSVSIFAETFGDQVFLSTRVLSTKSDASLEIIRESAPISKAKELGVDVANKLLKMGAAKIIAECRGE